MLAAFSAGASVLPPHVFASEARALDVLTIYRQLPDAACLPSASLRGRAKDRRDVFTVRNGLQFKPRVPREGRMQDLALFERKDGGVVVMVACTPYGKVTVFEQQAGAWIDRTAAYLPDHARRSRFYPKLYPRYQYLPEEGTVAVTDALAPSDFGRSRDGVLGYSHTLRWNGEAFERTEEEVER